MCPPPMRAKYAGGLKFASPSSSPPPSPSSTRLVVVLLSLKPSPDRAIHDALSPFWKWGSCRGWPTVQTQHLREELAQEHLKVGALEEELQDLHGQVSNYPWDMALLDQDLKKAQAERDVADREREGLRRAYFKDNPLRCCRIGAAVLSEFVINFQVQAPTLPALAEEYRRRFPVGWLDNTVPLPPLDQILPAP
ncbi:hypothetical protein LIER_05744 [Lithospermum erythrorhizon]|uniref:Uncharacterized protein n=1 Tax=Lithospermum erythrorhizon TaxID=34254 RepID=A0AAV3P386_LITER